MAATRKRLTQRQIADAHAERTAYQRVAEGSEPLRAFRTGKRAENGLPSLRELAADSPAGKRLRERHIPGISREQVTDEIVRRDKMRLRKRAVSMTVRKMTREEQKAADARRKAAAPPKRDKRKTATRVMTDRRTIAEPCFGTQERVTARILLWEDEDKTIPVINPDTGRQAMKLKSAPAICPPHSRTVTRAPGPDGNGTYVPVCGRCAPLVSALRSADYEIVDEIQAQAEEEGWAEA